MDIYHTIRRALITEKSTAAKGESNKYIFEVDRRANKIEVATAVEKLFKVKVLDVHVMNILGKKKRVGRVMGEKRSWKKAIVTLAPGNHIEIHEGV
jgi:large subunit ribosomal protein L23